MGIEIEDNTTNTTGLVRYEALSPYTLFEVGGYRYVTLPDEESRLRDLCLEDGSLSEPPEDEEMVMIIKENVEVKITIS